MRILQHCIFIITTLFIIYSNTKEINDLSKSSQNVFQNVRKLQDSSKNEENRIQDHELETQPIKSKLDEGLQKWKTKKQDEENIVDMGLLHIPESHFESNFIPTKNEDYEQKESLEISRQKQNEESSIVYSSSQSQLNTINSLVSVKTVEMCRLDDSQSIPNDSLLQCTVFRDCEKTNHENSISNSNLESTSIIPSSSIEHTIAPIHSHTGHEIPAIPSIEEWKVQVLSKVATSNSNSNEQPDFKQKVQTKRPDLGSHSFNYASIECGAKVLSANPEALDTSASVLNEGKDKYMLNECGVKKFLIIELCEEIDVSSIEIGNFEFFSSMIKDFVLYGSTKYPGEWTHLGNFTAENKREMQYFIVPSNSWCKYVKIDFITHYGEEFYCPISIIRVHGYTVEQALQEQFEKDSQEIEQITSVIRTNTEQEKQTEHSVFSDTDSPNSQQLNNTVLKALLNLVVKSDSSASLSVPNIISPIAFSSSEIDNSSSNSNISSNNVEVPHNTTSSDSNNHTSSDSNSSIHRVESQTPKNQENILKTLANKIKVLEINQSIYVKYLEDVTSRYTTLFREIKSNLDKVQQDQADLASAIMTAIDHTNNLQKEVWDSQTRFEKRVRTEIEEIQRAIAGLSTSINFEIASLRDEMRSRQDTQRINEIIFLVIIVLIVFAFVVQCIILTPTKKRLKVVPTTPEERKLSSLNLSHIKDSNDNNSAQEEDNLSETGSDTSQEFQESPIKVPKLKKAQSFAFASQFTSEAPL